MLAEDRTGLWMTDLALEPDGPQKASAGLSGCIISFSGSRNGKYEEELQ